MYSNFTTNECFLLKSKVNQGNFEESFITIGAQTSDFPTENCLTYKEIVTGVFYYLTNDEVTPNIIIETL